MKFKKFPTRKDDHIGRKFYHMGCGTLAAYVFLHHLDRKETIIIMLIATLLIFAIDLLRLRNHALNRWVHKIMGGVMRKEETKNISAQTFYVFGMLWLALFFSKPIVVHSLLVLAWLDPIAGFFGLRFGKTPWRKAIPDRVEIPNASIVLRNKTIEGSFAGFIAAFLAGIVAWTGRWASVPATQTGMNSTFWPSPLQVLVISGVAAIVAVVAEAWPAQWDDNIMIPFWASLAIWAIVQVLGIPTVFA